MLRRRGALNWSTARGHRGVAACLCGCVAQGLRAFRTLVRVCTVWCGPARTLLFPSVFVMGVVVRARVARVVRVLEVKVLAIVHTLQRLEVAYRLASLKMAFHCPQNLHE